MRSRGSASARPLAAVAGSAVLLALVTVTPASARRDAGIAVTAAEPVIAVIGAGDPSGVFQAAVLVSARFSPEALHDDVRVTLISTKPGGIGASPVSAHDGGNVLHATAVYQVPVGVFQGERLLITAKWNAYTPEVGSTPSGTKTVNTVFQVPKREPAPRLVSEKKQRLARKSTDRFAVCAIAGIAAGLTAEAPPLAVALGAMAAESCAAGAMYQDMALDPVDPNFRSVAKPKTPRPLRVTTGEGLSAAATSALNQLLALQAKEIGLGRAIVTAFNRSQGAHVKNQTAWERKQVLAAGKYAAQLSPLMLAEATLLPKVRRSLTGPATVSEEQAFAFQRSLVHRSLPVKLASSLSSLGLTRAQLKEVRAQLVVRNNPTLYDGDAIAAIADPASLSLLRQVAADLKAFAKEAAKDPLNTGT